MATTAQAAEPGAGGPGAGPAAAEGAEQAAAAAAPAATERRVAAGDHVVLDINNGDKKVLAVATQGYRLKLGRDYVSVQPMLGQAYGELYRLTADRRALEKVDRKRDFEWESVLDEERNNSKIVDNGQAQTLTPQQIEELKREGLEGEEVLGLQGLPGGGAPARLRQRLVHQPGGEDVPGLDRDHRVLRRHAADRAQRHRRRAAPLRPAHLPNPPGPPPPLVPGPETRKGSRSSTFCGLAQHLASLLLKVPPALWPCWSKAGGGGGGRRGGRPGPPNRGPQLRDEPIRPTARLSRSRGEGGGPPPDSEKKGRAYTPS